MRHFIMYDENGRITAYGIGYDGVEISEEEYDALLERKQRTNVVTNAVLNGEMAIDEVDEDIQEDVRQNVVALLANDMYFSKINLEDVPTEFVDDVRDFAETLIAEYGEYVPKMSEAEVITEEALAILRGEITE